MSRRARSEPETLDAVRERLASLQEELATLRSAIRIPSEIEANVRRLVEAQAGAAAANLHSSILAGNSGDLGDSAAMAANAPGFIYLVAGLENSVANLTAQIEAQVDHAAERISEGDKASKIANCMRQILATEIAEEALIRRSEVNGAQSIQRRSDANPALFLAAILDDVIVD